MDSTPCRRHFSEMSFSVCNVLRGWFIGIKWALGSDDLGSFPARAVGFNHIMTLNTLCTYTRAIANQTIHPFGVGKLIMADCRGNSTLPSARSGEEGG